MKKRETSYLFYVSSPHFRHFNLVPNFPFLQQQFCRLMTRRIRWLDFPIFRLIFETRIQALWSLFGQNKIQEGVASLLTACGPLLLGTGTLTLQQPAGYGQRCLQIPIEIFQIIKLRVSRKKEVCGNLQLSAITKVYRY